MNHTPYIRALRRQLIASYQNFQLEKATVRQEWQFAVCSTNFYHALPHLPQRRYLHTFKQLHINRRLSFLDIEHMSYPGIIQIKGWSLDWLAQIRNKPGIICTYHTGSYRLINYLLASANVPFSLVVAQKALQAEEEAKNRVYQSLAKEWGGTLDFDLINAEESHALIHMAKALKEGKSLVVYIDGNTGTETGNDIYRNLLQLDFFNQKIVARKGIAALAYHRHVPIYPILCKRTGHNTIYYQNFPAIMPYTHEEKAFFEERAIRKLYTLLENFLRRYPEQWEGWLSFHNSLIASFIKKRQPNEETPLKEWSIFRHRGKTYGLHRPTYHTYPISRDQYEAIKSVPRYQ